MDENIIRTEELPNSAESFHNVPQDAAGSGNMPQPAADYRSVRNDAERYGNIRHVAERKETHVLSVREVARMFEASGVARIERSIINWCQQNRQGVARLDAYFDENERRWLITPESVERAIAEEKSKLVKGTEQVRQVVEPGVDSARVSEQPKKVDAARAEAVSERSGQLERELLELKILNAGKDYFIDQLRKERDGFIQELREGSRRVGQLESELRQLTAREPNSERRLPHGFSESSDTRGTPSES